MRPLKPPYPYFGSKRAIASVIWEALGDVAVYIEPFFSSGSILLARPSVPKVETVNDLCGFVTNFWRALQADPDALAHYADWPVHELELHAVHPWLMAQAEGLAEKLRSDPDCYDAKIAGRWVWGLCCWIGHGWCKSSDSHLRSLPLISADRQGNGVHQACPMIAANTHGLGVHQTLWAARPAVQGDHPSSNGGVNQSDNLHAWFDALATRLRRVRVCCGDWKRICTPVVLNGPGATGIVLDPPYSHQERDTRLYSQDIDIAAEVAAWAWAQGANPKYRIVLCGYTNEHEMPGWTCSPWAANGGYGNQGNNRARKNRERECLWFSPQCQTVTTQMSLL